MFKQILYDGFTKMSPYEVHRVVKFLFENQGKCVIGKNDITSAIEYAMKDRPSFGGYVVTMESEKGEIIAATVVNKTGMAGYGPENILVYFATQEDSRNYDACRKLLEKTISVAKEDIAFLVTPDNPWKAIFRKLGFESKLLEMNYTKPNRKSKAS